MFEDRVQRRDGSRGDAFAASRRAAATAGSWLRRLAGRDVGLGALDVAEFEGTDLPSAEQRLDVGFNRLRSIASVEALMARRRRPRMRPPSASVMYQSQISVTVRSPAALVSSATRIDALGHGDELFMGEGTGLLDGHQVC